MPIAPPLSHVRSTALATAGSAMIRRVRGGRDRGRPEAGQILIIFTISQVAVIAIAGLLVDGDMAWTNRRQAQNAGDVAALAAAKSWSTTADMPAATTAARNIAASSGIPVRIPVRVPVRPDGSNRQDRLDRPRQPVHRHQGGRQRPADARQRRDNHDLDRPQPRRTTRSHLGDAAGGILRGFTLRSVDVRICGSGSGDFWETYGPEGSDPVEHEVAAPDADGCWHYNGAPGPDTAVKAIIRLASTMTISRVGRAPGNQNRRPVTW